MTKYKEYLRAKGIKLECDFGVLPYRGLETVETRVMDDCIVAIAYFNNTTPQYVVCDRYGEHGWYDTCGDMCFVERFNRDPAYDELVEDRCCWLPASVYDTVVKAMKDIYVNDTTVNAAYKHMRAGIMREQAFAKLLAKHCQRTTAIEISVED